MNQAEVDAFLAIVESGSLTRAAQKLYLTQSTLSSRLDCLEKELGAPLLIRKKGIRRVELTEAGKKMVPVAKKWKKLWQETKEIIWKEDRQTMFLSTIQSVQTYLMGPVYREFLDRADNCDMCILALDSGDTYKLIESGELEAGLIANPGYSRTVASIPCFRNRCVLYAGQAAPTAVRFIPHPCRSEMKSIWSGILSLSCGTPTGSETGDGAGWRRTICSY